MADEYSEALRIVDETVRAHGFEPRALSTATRTVYLVTQLDFEIATGGVIQWLTNRSGRYAYDTAAALP